MTIANFLFYIFLALIPTILVIPFSKKRKPKIKLYLLSAAFIIIFLSFSKLGTDKEAYVIIYNNISIEKILDIQNQEFGFNIINFLLYQVFGPSRYIPFIFFYTLMVGLTYYVIYKYKDVISVPLAVFIFFTLICIQSISLLRIYVSASILLLANLHLSKNKYFKTFILILIATSIHYTSIYFISVLIAKFLLTKFSGNLKIKSVVIISLMFIVTGIAAYFLPHIPLIERYLHYFMDNYSFDIGILQFLIYIPLFFLVFYLKPPKKIRVIILANLIPCFTIAITSYSITILGRIVYLFSFILIIAIPYFYKQLKIKNKEKFKQYNSLNEITVNHAFSIILKYTVIFYVLIRFYLYIAEFQILDGISFF